MLDPLQMNNQTHPDDQVLDYIRHLNKTNLLEEVRRDTPALS